MQRIFSTTTSSLIKRNINLPTPFPLQVVPACVRTYASSGNKVGDHRNFNGPQAGNANHSSFNGPQDIPPKLDLEEKDIEQMLRQDAALKHKQAAQNGDIVVEMQARVEQSLADRMRDHEQPKIQSQQRVYDEEEFETRYTTVYALRQEAARTQQLAERRNNDALREEAQLERAVAEMLAQPKTTQSLFVHQETHIEKPLIGPNGAFRSGYELKLDAAQKQSIATKTHDQQLMNEAHLEQSIADTLSPNVGGQPLYGTGPKHHRNRNNNGHKGPSAAQQSNHSTSAQQQPKTQQRETTPMDTSTLHELASNGKQLLAEKEQVARQHFVQQQQIAHQQVEQQAQQVQQNLAQSAKEYEQLTQKRNEEQNAMLEDFQEKQALKQRDFLDASESAHGSTHRPYYDKMKWNHWL